MKTRSESKNAARLIVEQTRQTAASVKKAEGELEQSGRVILQLTPEIRQTVSNQDMREIRLALLLENKGARDAIVQRIEARVEDGAAKGSAAQTLVDTQNYYYERLEFARQNNSRSRAPNGSQIIEPNSLFPTQPAAKQESTAKGSNLADQAIHKDAGPDEPVIRDPSRGLSQHLAQVLPFHENCPHGQIIALSGASPSLAWTPIEAAKQSIENPYVLRPTQATTHHFNYLLTENPLQHNHQWLRFRIAVEYSSDKTPGKREKQDYECIVSGLGSSDEPEWRVTSYGYDEPDRPSPTVWRPIAPLMPTATTEK